MQAAQVIPFKFETREIRTLLVDDQPWFVVADVSAALEYSVPSAMTRHLDEDEKGVSIVHTPGGDQEMLVINESGLYSAILRSRKAEAKRFKKWVTAEVLPAIRKHGRYDDEENKLNTLVGQTIGTDGFHCLAAVVDGKLRHLPAAARRRARGHLWSQVHKAFSVVSAEHIPASQLEAARNFIAAYALEGEWLGREEKPEALFSLDFERSQDLSLLLHYTDWLMHRWNSEIRTGLKELNPELYGRTWEFFDEAQRAARRLDKGMPELTAYFQSRSGGKRPAEYAAAGLVA